MTSKTRDGVRCPRLKMALALLLGLVGLLMRPADAGAADGGVVIIGNANLPHLESSALPRLYTGRAVEWAGQAVTVVNASPGSTLRQRFLQQFLRQDDDQYRAYWTVRRHVGKGVPPRELATTAEMIQFVQSTPGAIGYIDAADIQPGMNVLAR